MFRLTAGGGCWQAPASQLRIYVALASMGGSLGASPWQWAAPSWGAAGSGAGETFGEVMYEWTTP